jgi:hypothetical protein
MRGTIEADPGRRAGRGLAVLVAAAFLLAAGPTAGPRPQSEVRLADVEAGAGQKVVVPVKVRDRQGTPLGPERRFGERVQALSFKVVALPAGAVQSIRVRRAGVTAGLAPLFEARPAGGGSGSLVVSFDEAGQPLPWVLSDRTAQKVAAVEVTLAPGLRRGTVVELRLDPVATMLSNQAGTVAETVANGWLAVRDGRIAVVQ